MPETDKLRQAKRILADELSVIDHEPLEFINNLEHHRNRIHEALVLVDKHLLSLRDEP